MSQNQPVFDNLSPLRRFQLLLVLLLVALALISLFIGTAHLDYAEVRQGLVYGDGVSGIILRDIRLPRLLLSMMVGGTLGLCGAAMQGLLRNPLAEPAIFGAPQAAALGAVIVLYSGLSSATSWLLPAAAIFGAFVSVALVVFVAGRGAGLVTLILAGLAVATLCGAGTSLALNLSPNPFAVTEIVFWLMGSFEDRSMRHVAIAAPFLFVAMIILLLQRRGYRALTLGEETARSLGINLDRVSLMTALGVALGVGAGVAVSGAIGFVGLVAPHLVRGIAKGDPANTLIPSALAGAALLTAADILVRLIPATSEIKVGVITAILGVPLFLTLVLTRRVAFDGDDV